MSDLTFVHIVYRLDDESTHIFSTPEKAQDYAEKIWNEKAVACVFWDYALDEPLRYYEVHQ